MSVEQIEKIDFISTSPDSKGVTLTISDHLSWEEIDHLEILQNKLNSYLHFIESGQLFVSYPNARNKELAIMVYLKFKPNSKALTFLNQSKKIIVKEGIEFEWMQLDALK